MCNVLDHEDDVRTLLGQDSYLINARKLATTHGKGVDDTGLDIQRTIHARMSQVKILAAQLERNRKRNGEFSLRRFVTQEQGGVFVISRDDTFESSHDAMNGVILGRLMELLDQQQEDPNRKVFVVIDEFHQLSGKLPCPKIEKLFLLMRSRGATGLLTYQALTTLKTIYGEGITDALGQCGHVIHLKQADNPSAEYAATELGKAWMTRGRMSPSVSEGRLHSSRHEEHYYDYYFDPTKLMYLPEASATKGVNGVAKSTCHDTKPWAFHYPPSVIDGIPKTDKQKHPLYLQWGNDAQEIEPLTRDERLSLGLPVAG